MLTTPSPLISTAEPAVHSFPQLLCDKNQIQNAHDVHPDLRPRWRVLSLHSDLDFMRSCGDVFSGASSRTQTYRSVKCVSPADFALNRHLKQGARAAHTLRGQPRCAESQ